MTKPPLRAIIVVADFHRAITDGMIKAARLELTNRRVQLFEVIRVPGCYEIPLAVQTVIKRDQPDVLVILGYIERGHTRHGEVMGYVIQQALISLQLQYHLPMGIGIIGPGATKRQAQARQEKTAISAVCAALASHQLLSSKFRRDTIKP